MEVGYVEEFEHGDFDRFCFGGGSNGYFVDDLRSLDVEHPKVKKARFAVSKVTQLEHKLHCLQAEIDRAKREAAEALRQMQDSGEPDEPWAKHWRECVVLESAN
jgi:uncharacterized small protein (DUF1192 family)